MRQGPLGTRAGRGLGGPGPLSLLPLSVWAPQRTKNTRLCMGGPAGKRRGGTCPLPAFRDPWSLLDTDTIWPTHPAASPWPTWPTTWEPVVSKLRRHRRDSCLCLPAPQPPAAAKACGGPLPPQHLFFWALQRLWHPRSRPLPPHPGHLRSPPSPRPWPQPPAPVEPCYW